jgi:hypothetical protein
MPQEFICGTGLPKDVAKDLLAAVGNPDFRSCFISYSHEDKAFAFALENKLHDGGVRQCFRDETILLAGDDIYAGVIAAVRRYDKVLLCCSRNSLKRSAWVEREVREALRKEELIHKDVGRGGLALIPLNIDGYMFSEEFGESPYSTEIRRRQAVNFENWESDLSKMQSGVKAIVKALRLR